MNQHPWDQQPNEPPQAYSRFLTYRNLGPGRSVAQAVAERGGKRQRAPGQWDRDSAAFDWIARATAWDIHNLQAHGAELAVIWAEMVFTAARKALEKLRQPKCKPADFTEAVKTIDTLAKYVNADALTHARQIVQPALPASAGTAPLSVGARGNAVVPDVAPNPHPGIPLGLAAPGRDSQTTPEGDRRPD